MSASHPMPLLVGASGQVGSQLLHLLGPGNCLLSLRTPSSQAALALDLASLESVAGAERILGNHDLTAIYCVGGMTNVDACEDTPDLAFATNCRGPAVLARVAAQRAIPFVYFSTEYVFDGYNGPYMEESATNPLSVYGKSKRQAELSILSVCPRALVLRTTVVYGQDHRQKNYIYTLMRLLRAGKSIRVPSDQVSTPTYNSDLARATVLLAQSGATGIYHVCGPQRMDRLEFARRVAAFLGLDQSLLVATPTSALGQKAPRPLSAGLSIDKLRLQFPGLTMRTLAESLEDCRSRFQQFLLLQPAPG